MSKLTDPINLVGVTNLVPNTSSYKLKAFYHHTLAAIQVSIYNGTMKELGLKPGPNLAIMPRA